MLWLFNLQTMAYKKWQASRLHTGKEWASDGTVLVTNEQGTIIEILTQSEAGEDVEKLEGVLCPGFVNAHCHLELSHLKGHIPPHTGMVDFLLQVMQLRRFRMEEKVKAMEAAVAEMRGNGVVAVGDTSNGTDSIGPKLASDLYFHNFIEITGFVPSTAQDRWQAGVEVADVFLQSFPPEQVTITPHAPYSVSPQLLQIIMGQAPGKSLSIHLMESEDEIAFFREKQGDFNRLYAQLGIHIDFFKQAGTSSLRYFWPYLKTHAPWLWVHNTEVSLHDLQWLDQQGIDWTSVFFCLCPGANQYINFATPAIHRFRHQLPIQLCLGTDSLAGNYYLNPLYEMRLMQKHGRLNDLGFLLQMATLNGARALGIQHNFGSFEKGKEPGLVLIKGLESDVFTAKTKAERVL
jgi:cytosine/adenosine deaminase-related metal-dependent hydrolase